MNKSVYVAGIALAFVFIAGCEQPVTETEQVAAPAAAESVRDRGVNSIDADGNVAPFGMASKQPVAIPETRIEEPPAAAEVSAVYATQCVACHGADAKGVPGLGLNLVDSELVDISSQSELVAFLQEGRAGDSPDSVTKVPMPSFVWMDEGDLVEVTLYIKGL
jgi:mono/diheme cytochrome c family protein